MSLTTTDPIADMLARIRNALLVNKATVVMPHSRVKEAVAKILKENNYISDLKVNKAKVGADLEITLVTKGGVSPINSITRTSTPGRRFYVSADKIPTVKQGRGIVVISTNKGVMTGDQARAKRVGGELVCEVY